MAYSSRDRNTLMMIKDGMVTRVTTLLPYWYLRTLVPLFHRAFSFNISPILTIDHQVRKEITDPT
jgi:hypothetical protein